MSDKCESTWNYRGKILKCEKRSNHSGYHETLWSWTDEMLKDSYIIHQSKIPEGRDYLE